MPVGLPRRFARFWVTRLYRSQRKIRTRQSLPHWPPVLPSAPCQSFAIFCVTCCASLDAALLVRRTVGAGQRPMDGNGERAEIGDRRREEDPSDRRRMKAGPRGEGLPYRIRHEDERAEALQGEKYRDIDR